jgi:hypothetical protein
MAKPRFEDHGGMRLLDDGVPTTTAAGDLYRDSANVKFHDGTAARTLAKAEAVPDLVPAADDTYYLGENSSPFKAFKGLVLKDTTDGKHYRIQVTNGSLEAIALD